MLPQLTESWANSYLQISIILFMFSLSIPTIVFQLTQPEEIQRIVYRFMKWHLFSYSLLIFFLMVQSLLFIWFFHPVSTPTSGKIACVQDIWSASLITFFLLATTSVWLINLRKFTRDRVVNYLSKKIFKRFERDKAILCDEIDVLVTLGERSEAGYEKEIVLKAIDQLFMKILNSPLYSGGSLEYLLRKYHKIVCSKDKPGYESDFQFTVNTLEKLMEQMDVKISSEEVRIKSDIILVYWLLTAVGKRASELRLSQVAKQIVSLISSDRKSLLEIGISAFKSGDFNTALHALNKLKYLIPKESTGENQELSDYLGLLSYFWTGNKGTKRTASKFLNLIEREYSPILKYIERAIESHYQNVNYEITDKLMMMKEEIETS